jgi:hypothetical protein
MRISRKESWEALLLTGLLQANRTLDLIRKSFETERADIDEQVCAAYAHAVRTKQELIAAAMALGMTIELTEREIAGTERLLGGPDRENGEGGMQ